MPGFTEEVSWSHGLSEGSGVIDALGAGVSSHSLGMPVWLWGIAGRIAGPAEARHLIVPVEQTASLPDGVQLDAGACLGRPAVAAMHAVLSDGGVAGKRVLAASGVCSIGHYVLQFARLAGAAQVIAGVRDACDAGAALDAGAHAVVIEGEDDLSQRIQLLTAGQGVDRVIDVESGGNVARHVGLVGTGGDTVVVHSGRPVRIDLPAHATARGELRLRFVDVQTMSQPERARALHSLQAWLERGLVRLRISARFSAERMSEARQLARSGQTIGHVLLSVA
jgi:NADPH:quinone reductase